MDLVLSAHERLRVSFESRVRGHVRDILSCLNGAGRDVPDQSGPWMVEYAPWGVRVRWMGAVDLDLTMQDAVETALRAELRFPRAARMNDSWWFKTNGKEMQILTT